MFSLNCLHCAGSGYDETGSPPLACEDCEGEGRARCEMRGCKERAVGFNADGEALCEDCLEDWCAAQVEEDDDACPNRFGI